MEKNTSFLLGLIAGAIAPVLAYAFRNLDLSAVGLGGKDLIVYVLALVINLFSVRFLYKKGKAAQANGIVLATFMALVLFLLFGRI